MDNSEEVPLQVWDIKFFKALGDMWGAFIKIDEDTVCRRRFDITRLLVMVDSKLKIPSYVTVKHGDAIFKLVVTLEKDIKQDASATVDKTSNLDGAPCMACMAAGAQRFVSRANEVSDMSMRLFLTLSSNDSKGDGEFSSRLSVEELIGSKDGSGINATEIVPSSIFAAVEIPFDSQGGSHMCRMGRTVVIGLDPHLWMVD
ncbi:hypothetical protein PTKIN_Ptkin06aG0046700 [Pterospermum kingtungense]